MAFIRRDCTVRITPSQDPSSSENTHAVNASASVQPTPIRIVSRKVCTPSGDISRKTLQLQL